MNLVALGLLGGAAAKSAQVPLHTWLPDAMEGPTPVSALIHAATMVTAGVYLIARTHPIFEQARTVELVAAGMGALTLLVAGLIALVQTDIKRVIAYSTMSQIGYMFLGAGVGAYSSGMFHLMTHAFFKALLFMAAGLVIHALSGEQDIRKMSGIGQLMPWTRWAFLAGALALVGVPPFAGFFSKDAIIAAALHDHWYGVVFWVVALIGAFLTGLYTFRMYFIVFPRLARPVRARAPSRRGTAKGRATMLAPGRRARRPRGGRRLDPVLAALASASRTGSRPVAATLGVAEPTSWQDGLSSALAVGLGLAGIGVAYALYGRERVAVPQLPAACSARSSTSSTSTRRTTRSSTGPRQRSRRRCGRDFEEPVILTASGDIGDGALEVGRGVRRLQTGLLRTYVFFLGAGMAVVAVVFLVVR